MDYIRARFLFLCFIPHIRSPIFLYTEIFNRILFAQIFIAQIIRAHRDFHHTNLSVPILTALTRRCAQTFIAESFCTHTQTFTAEILHAELHHISLTGRNLTHLSLTGRLLIQSRISKRLPKIVFCSMPRTFFWLRPLSFGPPAKTVPISISFSLLCRRDRKEGKRPADLPAIILRPNICRQEFKV